MKIINLEFHFGVHDRCGEMELRRRCTKLNFVLYNLEINMDWIFLLRVMCYHQPRWRWYKQWEIDGRGKILKRVNYLGRQTVHLPRKGCRYKMKLLVDKSGGLGGAKKGLARSSLEEVNQARKVAGLAPLEEGRGLRREVGLKPLTEGGESLREALTKGNFKPESSQIFELMEKIHSGGRHALSSNKWSRISPSYKGPSLDMVDSDEANNNTVVDGKE